MFSPNCGRGTNQLAFIDVFKNDDQEKVQLKKDNYSEAHGLDFFSA